jgi:hypothetical protein
VFPFPSSLPGQVWLVGCVVSVGLIIWLLFRMNSRCQLSLLSLEGLCEMFLFGFFSFGFLIF